VIIAYSPLAQGVLSGSYHQPGLPANLIRAASPRFSRENLQRTSDLIVTLREVADAHSATPAQIALAWVIRSPAVTAIPGASSVEQLESNVAAADIDLADDEYLALNTASAPFRQAAAAGTGRPGLSAIIPLARGGWHVAKTIAADLRGNEK
jgi:aryl-alcohol dehydrogenase-like predicted oxidoreductase